VFVSSSNESTTTLAEEGSSGHLALMCLRRRSTNYGGACGRRDGPKGRPSPTGHRACSSRRCRSSCIIGAPEYDCGRLEARLNTFPHFISEIDGLDIHVTVFPGEQYQAPDSWAEQAYPNLIYSNQVDKGGHFAASEQPQLFSEELRGAFRSLH
jgi:hypothetical protein